MLDKDFEKKKLTIFLGSIKSEMEGIMSSRRMDASGVSRSMIETKVEEDSGDLLGPAHIEFMERGRGPGKFPPISTIMDWIDDKGIKSDIPKASLAFLIARKIANEGSVLHRTGQKSGILSKTITPERIDTFFKEYTGEKFIEITKGLRPLIRA